MQLSRYSIGTYIRLSLEDGDKFESESISNQRNLISMYVKENNLQITDEYVDDGYTGTNTNRPAFQRLLADIENNKINMVITKDLSRLGRDYIEIGNLLEDFFLLHNVRYVSILDNIDTYLDVDTDIIPIKSLLNDMYSKDISRKVSSAKQERAKLGIYQANIPIYGYIKNKYMPGGLQIDKTAAIVIAKIFRLRSEGYTLMNIVNNLTDNKIPTPAIHLGHERSTFKHHKWTVQTIRRILTNEMYIGNCVCGKSKTINYKTKKRIFTKKENFIIVPNTHVPIVSKNIFREVQNTFQPHNSVKVNKVLEGLLLRDLLYCKECGSKLRFKYCKNKQGREYVYINCPMKNINNDICQNTIALSYFEVENIILSKIRKLYEQYFLVQKAKNNILNSITLRDTNLLKRQIQQLEKEQHRIKQELNSLYNKRLDEKISESSFIKEYKELQNEKIKIEEELTTLKQDLEKLQQNLNTEEQTKILEKLDNIANSNNYEKYDVESLINKIEINMSEIHISYKFKELNFY